MKDTKPFQIPPQNSFVFINPKSAFAYQKSNIQIIMKQFFFFFSNILLEHGFLIKEEIIFK
jgi:hypothetical protein